MRIGELGRGVPILEVLGGHEEVFLTLEYTTIGLGWAGVGSGLVAIVLALGFGEGTKADQAAFVLPVLWQFVVALTQLAGRRGAAA